MYTNEYVQLYIATVYLCKPYTLLYYILRTFEDKVNFLSRLNWILGAFWNFIPVVIVRSIDSINIVAVRISSKTLMPMGDIFTETLLIKTKGNAAPKK